MNNERGFMSKNRLQKNAKAQLEMIGLVIIVIIVITGMLFFLVYKLSNPGKNLQKTYMNKEMATNFLISLTKTSVQECHDIALSELITDCAKTYHTYTCNEYTSCEIVNLTLIKILDKTLMNWSISFNLTIQNINLTFINLNCTSKTRERERGFSILPLYPGEIEMTLDICKR